MDSLTTITDLDNMIYEYVRYVRPTNVKSLLEEIKMMEFEEYHNINYEEKKIYYNKTKSFFPNSKYLVLDKCLIITCCNRCGNFKHFVNDNKHLKCNCKSKKN